MRQIYSLLAIITILISFLTVLTCFSEDPPEPWDSKGTDFWLTFIPNFHNNLNSPDNRLKFGDSLYIFIASSVPTSGNIQYFDRNAKSYNQPFTINDPTKVYSFSVSSYYFELLGYNKQDRIEYDNDKNDCEKKIRLSFHVTSKDDVTVYAHSQANTTSDAFMVFPTDVLGNDYFVSCYKSHGDGYWDNMQNKFLLTTTSTPSQFAILATENNTQIKISPTTPTYIRGKGEQIITLDIGEAYLVQAANLRDNNFTDLTGTEIHSNKPVAVFAGHQRATVPVELIGSNPSRDILVEQMPPLKNWGKNALITPFKQPRDIAPQAYDLFRVLSGYDNNKIYINGFYELTLNKGEFFEDKLLKAAHISAEFPILVSQIKSTSSYDPPPGGTAKDGDPFLMILPPIEQYMDNYLVVNAQSKEYRTYRYENVYDEQYITVILPNTAKNSLIIDGSNASSQNWIQVPASAYSYAHIKVTDGAHSVKAKEPFGIQIYGYGYANSYGYIGGMSFKPHDYHKPEILAKDTCFKINGIALDTAYLDSGIDSCYVIEESKQNVRVQIENFRRYADSVRFSGELSDIYQDGKFSIAVVDSFGQKNTADYEIPGFTIKMYFSSNKQELNEKGRIGMEYCYDIIIENYGKFEHTVDYSSFKTNTGKYSIKGLDFPLALQPGETAKGQLCFWSEDVGEFRDTLLIGDNCIARTVLTAYFNAVTDNKKPEINQISDPCNRYFQLVFTDSTSSDFGLMSEEVIKVDNCSIERLAFTPKVLVYNINVIDPWQDAYFEFEVTDSVGNSTHYSYEIPGFTINFSIQGDSASEINYGDKNIGTVNADSIRLYNYGKYKIIFDNARFFENILFSAAPAQFPLEIPSLEDRFLKIYYHPISSHHNPNIDTVYFEHNCLIVKIPLEGDGFDIFKNGTSRCDVDISVKISEVPRYYFLEQNFPNPAIETSSLIFGNPERSNIEINLYDAFGRKALSLAKGEFSAGVYKIGFSTYGLSPGAYYYQMTTPNGSFTKSMIIGR